MNMKIHQPEGIIPKPKYFPVQFCEETVFHFALNLVFTVLSQVTLNWQWCCISDNTAAMMKKFYGFRQIVTVEGRISRRQNYDFRNGLAVFGLDLPLGFSAHFGQAGECISGQMGIKKEEVTICYISANE